MMTCHSSLLSPRLPTLSLGLSPSVSPSFSPGRRPQQSHSLFTIDTKRRGGKADIPHPANSAPKPCLGSARVGPNVSVFTAGARPRWCASFMPCSLPSRQRFVRFPSMSPAFRPHSPARHLLPTSLLLPTHLEPSYRSTPGRKKMLLAKPIALMSSSSWPFHFRYADQLEALAPPDETTMIWRRAGVRRGEGCEVWVVMVGDGGKSRVV